MSRSEHEGRSVWENCPVVVGAEIFLYVAALPEMAVRIGDYRARNLPDDPGQGPLALPGPTRFVNGLLLGEGPWPGGSSAPARRP